MEDSILTSTKKVLGLQESYEVFDQDILMHINAAFSTMNQLGVGPLNGYYIEDKEATWSELNLPVNQASMVRSYVFLKVRLLFDPPSTSYLIEAAERQVKEFEWRLNVFREMVMYPLPEEVITP